jgi:hypothetical protein
MVLIQRNEGIFIVGTFARETMLCSWMQPAVTTAGKHDRPSETMVEPG